ncbi:Endoplasmic reticulum calcium ATPase isoform 1 [Hibiscus syriacus]|uniref:Endoplasmic reticulum calcium ATPase isoform 1 n=1 Tax=Hibiscus syriacus TaxID=106335 RepID=A0A6A3BZQ4_HIBSY|nr:Endoplasmic reticulum calcium ATPase isoform 1 [Hibiscus syriacus]
MALLLPSCNRAFIDERREINPPPAYTSSVITGTMFCYRRGKGNFYIQANPKSKNDLILLEFGITTAALAREMKRK